MTASGQPCLVVGTDFSDNAVHALRRAVALATALGGRVELVHVVREQKPLFGSAGCHEAARLLQDTEVKESRRALQEQVGNLPIPVHTQVRVGDPCPTLLEFADEVDAELIVVGREGRGAAGRLLVGSHTDKIVRSSRRPVLVVPHAEP